MYMIKLILWACFEFNFLLAKQRCCNQSDDVTIKDTDYPPQMKKSFRELFLYQRDSLSIVNAVSRIVLFFGYLTRETLLTVSMNDYKIKVLYVLIAVSY